MSININELNTSIEQFGEDMNLTHNWVQGAVGSSVVLGGVDTPSIRSLVAALLNAGGAAVVRQTKAELAALLNHGENTLGFVTNDETAANNGWYIKLGASGTGSWQQSTYDRTVTQAQLAKYLHSEKVINASNAQEVCEGDADKIPVNTVYGYSYDADLEHMPVSSDSAYQNGQIVTLNSIGSVLNSTATQMYSNYSGNVFVRFYASNAWQPWFKVAMENDLAAYVKSTGTLILSTNAQEVCGGSLGNLPTGTVCAANGASGLDDLPVKSNGLVETLSLSASRQDGSTGYAATSMQSYRTAWHTFERYYSGGWQKWRTSVPVESVNVLGVGDSICQGYRNGNKGYVGELGLPNANYGISNWRLSSGSEYGPIASQLDTFAADAADSTKSVYGFVPDVIIADGGINDYIHNVPLGTVPTTPVEPSDTTTVIGGLQLLFYKMISMYPYAQRLFVLVHKMYKTDISEYLPTRVNSAGYTQEDLTNAIIETCRIYGVKPVDVYHEGQMDTKFNAYLGDWAANNDSSAWCNIDGVHPLHNGYVHAYVPLIWQALAGGTHKE